MKFDLVYIFNLVKSFHAFCDFAIMCQNQFIPLVKMSGITIEQTIYQVGIINIMYGISQCSIYFLAKKKTASSQ